jgi:hypothetical protein
MALFAFSQTEPYSATDLRSQQLYSTFFAMSAAPDG